MRQGVLEDIINFANGKSIKPRGVGEYSAYGANGVIGGSEDFNHEDAIILGRVGAYCGAVEKCDKKFWASDNTIVVRPNDKTFSKLYTYYLLKYLDLNKYAGGSAQPLLTQTTLKRVPIVYHEKKEDRDSIGELLAGYDNLIENNNRRIAILEEMAQSLYREWFVNFRFPGHENCQFKDSPLGQTPEGWEVVELGEFIDFWNGKKCIKSDDGEFPIYGANGIIGMSDRPRYENGIVIGRVGAYCGAVEYCFDKFWGSDNTIIAKCKTEENLSYLFLLLKLLNLNSYAGGAAQPLLTQGTLKRLQFILPTKNIIDEFDAVANNIFQSIDVLIKKNRNLKAQRNILLPKLISGKIDMRD